MLRMIHIHYVRGKCCLFIAEEMSLDCIYIVFLTVFCIQRVLENSVFVRIYNESDCDYQKLFQTDDRFFKMYF